MVGFRFWKMVELPEYPDIHVDLVIDYGLTIIVAERYDAGFALASRWQKT